MGRKITIQLEEADIPYNIRAINIGCGDQLTPDFLKISPNGRMPAIVDHEPIGGGAPVTIFESGAIMVYLAVKGGAMAADPGIARIRRRSPLRSERGAPEDATRVSEPNADRGGQLAQNDVCQIARQLTEHRNYDAIKSSCRSRCADPSGRLGGRR